MGHKAMGTSLCWRSWGSNGDPFLGKGGTLFLEGTYSGVLEPGGEVLVAAALTPACLRASAATGRSHGGSFPQCTSASSHSGLFCEKHLDKADRKAQRGKWMPQVHQSSGTVAAFGKQSKNTGLRESDAKGLFFPQATKCKRQSWDLNSHLWPTVSI